MAAAAACWFRRCCAAQNSGNAAGENPDDEFLDEPSGVVLYDIVPAARLSSCDDSSSEAVAPSTDGEQTCRAKRSSIESSQRISTPKNAEEQSSGEDQSSEEVPAAVPPAAEEVPPEAAEVPPADPLAAVPPESSSVPPVAPLPPALPAGETTSRTGSSVAEETPRAVLRSQDSAVVPVPPTASPWTDRESVQAQRAADEELRTLNQLRDSLVQVKLLVAQIKSYLEDEQLFKAQLAADTLGRLVAVHHETAVRHKQPLIADEFETVEKNFTESSDAQVLHTRINALHETLKLFHLESRFDPAALETYEDVAAMFPGPLHAADSHPSAAGFELSSTVDSRAAAVAACPVSSRSRKFFRLGSSGRTRTTTARVSRVLRVRRGRRKQHAAGHPPEPSSSAAWEVPQAKGGQAMRWTHRIQSDGSISVAIKVKLRVPLFRILAILNEVDYYPRWVPYCKLCKRLGEVSRASMLIQQLAEYPWPLKGKETLCYSQGIDALEEFGSVIVCSSSLPLNSQQFLGVALPPPTKKYTRIASGDILFLLSPLESNKSTVVELFANVETGLGNSALRNVLIPVMKTVVTRTVRGFFHKIGLLATNFESNGYATKVQANPAIYDWISARIQEVSLQNPFSTATSLMTLMFDELEKD